MALYIRLGSSLTGLELTREGSDEYFQTMSVRAVGVHHTFMGSYEFWSNSFDKLESFLTSPKQESWEVRSMDAAFRLCIKHDGECSYRGYYASKGSNVKLVGAFGISRPDDWEVL